MTRARRPALLLLGSQMAVGGAQHLLLAQARWFRERGYRIVAAFFYDKENIRQRWAAEHDIEIIDLRAWRKDGSMPANLLRLGAGLGRLIRLARRGRFDAIETFTHHANLLGLPVAWAAGIPLRIGTHHGRPAMAGGLGRLHSLLINCRLTSHFVAVSEHLRQEAITRECIQPGKTSVIGNGIPACLASARGSAVATGVLDELGLGPPTRLILNVGRLIPEKGQLCLIESMPQVLEHCPDARAIIVGDGELRAALQQRVQELQLTRAVLLPGTRADVPRLLAAAELFAYPSIRDGRPLALLEAMSLRVPVVASRIDAMTELLEHENSALLFRPGDRAALARALIQALENPEQMRDLARNAALHAEREFSMDTMCLRYEQLFRGADGLDTR